MKKPLFIALLFIISQINAQTNVSGGIFSNTTWLKANSPYIVTANVVVFPNVVLTIQPGVVVKFDSTVLLEIRQAGLIANGTKTDSITFTSNSSTPTIGIYEGVYLNGGTLSAKFNYCNFRYANNALNAPGSAGDTLIVKNSNFTFNKTGSYRSAVVYTVFDSCNFRHNLNAGVFDSYQSSFSNCDFSYNSIGIDGFNHAPAKINNCTFMHNQTGINFVTNSIIQNCKLNHNQIGINLGGSTCFNTRLKNSIIDSNTIVGIFIMGAGSGDSVIDCQIRYNPTGISDDGHAQAAQNVITRNVIENGSIGIELRGVTDTFYCNKICNNSAYGLKYMWNVNTSCVSHNYWCTIDSISTQPLIYDAHNNVAYSFAAFMPLDNSCYLTIGINENKTLNNTVSIYPNPTSDQFFIDASTSDKLNVDLYDVNGRQVFSKSVTDKSNIDVTILEEGVYTIAIKTADRVANKKLVIVH